MRNGYAKNTRNFSLLLSTSFSSAITEEERTLAQASLNRPCLQAGSILLLTSNDLSHTLEGVHYPTAKPPPTGNPDTVVNQ